MRFNSGLKSTEIALFSSHSRVMLHTEYSAISEIVVLVLNVDQIVDTLDIRCMPVVVSNIRR